MTDGYTISSELTLRPLGDDGPHELQIRELVLGIKPMVLIELDTDVDPDLGLAFEIDSTGPPDRAGLADLLELLVKHLRSEPIRVVVEEED